jgi:hypothetical protein
MLLEERVFVEYFDRSRDIGDTPAKSGNIELFYGNKLKFHTQKCNTYRCIEKRCRTICFCPMVQ